MVSPSPIEPEDNHKTTRIPDDLRQMALDDSLNQRSSVENSLAKQQMKKSLTLGAKVEPSKTPILSEVNETTDQDRISPEHTSVSPSPKVALSKLTKRGSLLSAVNEVAEILDK